MENAADDDVGDRRGCSRHGVRGPSSDLELRRLQPVPETSSGRLLQLGRVHGLDARRIEGYKVVFVGVGREALHEGLVGDVVLAPGALAAEALHRGPFEGSDYVVDGWPGRTFGLR